MALGYDPSAGRVVPLTPGSQPDHWTSEAHPPQTEHRLCPNLQISGCNWLVPVSDPNPFCRACRLSRTIPNLETVANREKWKLVESAKRRLVAALLLFGLPVVTKAENPVEGLAFDFLLTQPGSDPVMTGHEDGIITLNVEEADDSTRERTRQQMGEPYRTLLGHLRHEVGHYYWDRLIANRPPLDEFRQLFGDERVDYDQALAKYYREGPAPNWGAAFVSAYATSHPWEDWAESWAHYLHMTDSVSSAADFGVTIGARHLFEGFDQACLKSAAEESASFLELVNSWIALATLSNELARSMGHSDFYPFVLSQTSVAKLFFIHRVIAGSRKHA